MELVTEKEVAAAGLSRRVKIGGWIVPKVSLEPQWLTTALEKGEISCAERSHSRRGSLCHDISYGIASPRLAPFSPPNRPQHDWMDDQAGDSKKIVANGPCKPRSPTVQSPTMRVGKEDRFEHSGESFARLVRFFEKSVTPCSTDPTPDSASLSLDTRLIHPFEFQRNPMPQRMNVVVIACNGLHIGFLGPYGNAWIETPQIDRLAAEGIVFDHHYPENLTTLPTRRSWWTGRYGFPDAEQGWTPLRADEEILPDLLWSQGVRTALISDVPQLREAGQGFGRGFDEVVWVRGQGYDPFIAEKDPPHKASASKMSRACDYLSPTTRTLSSGSRVGNNTCAMAPHSVSIKRIPAARRGPQARRLLGWSDIKPIPSRFCSGSTCFSRMDLGTRRSPIATNTPRSTPTSSRRGRGRRFRRRGVRRRCRRVDRRSSRRGRRRDRRRRIAPPPQDLRRDRDVARSSSRRLFDALRTFGRMEDTLIVFTADQGEPLGEHGYVRRFRPWLYEELIHTPLIMRLPGGERGGTRQQSIVQTVDLLPTILAAFGLPPSERAQGGDLLALVRGRSAKIRDYACMGMDVEELAIRTHLWHLIVPINPDPDEDPPRVPELFRKPEDRWEQNDVIAEYPEVAEHLELTLRRFVEALERDDLSSPPFLRDVVRFTSQ